MMGCKMFPMTDGRLMREVEDLLGCGPKVLVEGAVLGIHGINDLSPPLSLPGKVETPHCHKISRA